MYFIADLQDFLTCQGFGCEGEGKGAHREDDRNKHGNVLGNGCSETVIPCPTTKASSPAACVQTRVPWLLHHPPNAPSEAFSSLCP